MLCFPPRQDVRLRRSPLTEVICQVRFPAIFRIANEHPVDFQERIRHQFPQVEIGQGMVVNVRPLADEPLSVAPGPRIFRFKSADRNTTATLAVDFYALSTSAYAHWEDFLALIQFLSRAACDIYDLPYASRVGLRYINNLTYENTGTANVSELLEILRPELVTLLQVDCWDEPVEMLNQLLLSGERDEKLTLRSGFKGREQPSLLLDFDYYAEGNIELETLPALCQRYHDVIYSAFRWCIRENRLSVFDPVPVDEEM